MTERTRATLVAAAASALLLAGLGLRLVNASGWPPGPWLDEAHALRSARGLPAGAPFAGSVPLLPPESGFVNFWVTTPWLRLTGLVDEVAGGGMGSIRAVSIGASVLLFVLSALLAREATRPSGAGFLGALALLATSSWLLATGRWGWIAVATTALLVGAAWAALVAARSGSCSLAFASGALLGLAQYGYPSAWLVLPLPLLAAAFSLLRRQRESARIALFGLVGTLLVAAPLALHYLREPDRILARPREISPLKGGPSATFRALALSAEAHGVRFLLRGDGNPRHGDPSRPVLPPAAVGLALAGGAAVLFRPGRERLLLAATVLLLLGGLLAVEAPGANSFRISPAAPFLLVLSGVGLSALLRAAPPRFLRQAGVLLGVTVAVTALLETRAFVRWASSPVLRGAFGGPERELADALAAALRHTGPAGVFVEPTRTCRSVFVVEALLGPPGPRERPSISLVRLDGGRVEWRFVPEGDVLLATSDTAEGADVASRLGGLRVATGVDLAGWGRWAVHRLPAAAVLSDARDVLARFPELVATSSGELDARSEGLYTFEARGPLRATLDGIPIFGSADRPATGSAVARLARGRHRLVVVALQPSARLRVVPPDGFVADEIGPEPPARKGR